MRYGDSLCPVERQLWLQLSSTHRNLTDVFQLSLMEGLPWFTGKRPAFQILPLADCVTLWKSLTVSGLSYLPHETKLIKLVLRRTNVSVWPPRVHSSSQYGCGGFPTFIPSWLNYFTLTFTFGRMPPSTAQHSHVP